MDRRNEGASSQYNVGALGSDVELRNGWSAFTSGASYPDELDNAMVEALMAAQVAAVNAALPAGWSWTPAVPALYGPHGEDPEEALGDLQALLDRTSDEVAERLDEIEREVRARLGVE